jgi:hypothetical protein
LTVIVVRPSQRTRSQSRRLEPAGESSNRSRPLTRRANRGARESASPISHSHDFDAVSAGILIEKRQAGLSLGHDAKALCINALTVLTSSDCSFQKFDYDPKITASIWLNSKATAATKRDPPRNAVCRIDRL